MPAASCILVVDDEFQIRRALKNALREVAERVVEAETGAEGIDLAAYVADDAARGHVSRWSSRRRGGIVLAGLTVLLLAALALAEGLYSRRSRPRDTSV